MKLIVGNWKMNSLVADARTRLAGLSGGSAYHMVVCPPATLVSLCVEALKGKGIGVGGQDCHAKAEGAYTGNIAAPMLKDLGCEYVILGHSERRQYHKETNADVAAKAKAAWAAGLKAIICVGETDEERTSGKANNVVISQLKESIPEGATPENTVVAYEPVWAIGTGKVASPEDVRSMHEVIRGQVGKLAILYGGSVKGSNAAEILHTPNVDGVLVGGASLKADEFMAIAKAA